MTPILEKDTTRSETERVQDIADWIDPKDILGRCLGNLALANRVLARFRDGLGDTLRQFDQLARQEDWKQIAMGLHRLKGEAANVGCVPLVKLASRVEEACARGAGESVRSSLEQLARACGNFQRQATCLTSSVPEIAQVDRPSVRPESNEQVPTP